MRKFSFFFKGIIYVSHLAYRPKKEKMRQKNVLLLLTKKQRVNSMSGGTLLYNVHPPLGRQRELAVTTTTWEVAFPN